MKNICSSCHSNAWIDDFYDGFDKAVEAYNEIYFKPAKAKLDELYEKGLLDKTKFFDKRLEVEDYELWHHEGRRARMGAMMMAPDYAWWHRFYEKAPFPAFGKGVFFDSEKSPTSALCIRSRHWGVRQIRCILANRIANF